MSGGSFRLLLGYSWIREQCQNSRAECIFKGKQSGKIWKSHSLAQEGRKKKWGLPLRKCLLKRLVAQKQASALHLNKEKGLEGISLFTKAAPPFTATGHLRKSFSVKPQGTPDLNIFAFCWFICLCVWVLSGPRGQVPQSWVCRGLWVLRTKQGREARVLNLFFPAQKNGFSAGAQGCPRVLAKNHKTPVGLVHTGLDVAFAGCIPWWHPHRQNKILDHGKFHWVRSHTSLDGSLLQLELLQEELGKFLPLSADPRKGAISTKWNAGPGNPAIVVSSSVEKSWVLGREPFQ